LVSNAPRILAGLKTNLGGMKVQNAETRSKRLPEGDGHLEN